MVRRNPTSKFRAGCIEQGVLVAELLNRLRGIVGPERFVGCVDAPPVSVSSNCREASFPKMEIGGIGWWTAEVSDPWFALPNGLFGQGSRAALQCLFPFIQCPRHVRVTDVEGLGDETGDQTLLIARVTASGGVDPALDAFVDDSGGVVRVGETVGPGQLGQGRIDVEAAGFGSS
jgi:hypothetical protein